MRVSMLRDAVLLRIFDFNADMTIPVGTVRKGTVNYDDFVLDNVYTGAEPGPRPWVHALTTTLWTSQVCRRWRQLLLASPSVWSRLLDVDVFENANTELIHEILKRAGDKEPLSIKGSSIPYPSPAADFVFWLVRQHWTRLEWIDVSIRMNARLTASESRFWKTITTPTKKLRHFYFKFSSPLIASPQILARDAPALRELSTSPSSPLHLDSPWLRQLTFLSIDGMGEPRSIAFKLPAFLDVLYSIPNLETLQLIDTRLAQGDYGDHHEVKLAGLRSLTLKDEFNTCFTILRHVIPSSECKLDIHARSPRSVPEDEYWKFDHWMEQYLMKRTYNDKISIDLQPNYAEFIDAYPDCYPAPTINLRVDYAPVPDQPDAQSFFSFLPRQRFTHVKHARLRMNLPNLDEDWLEFLLVCDDFFCRLGSLEVLKTSLQGFYLFALASASIDDTKEMPIPLPQLQRLRIIPQSDPDTPRPDQYTELGPQFILEFKELFKKRRHRQKPIRHLDVRDCVGDLTELEVFKGLRVTWMTLSNRLARDGVGDYICGNGYPEVMYIK